MKLVLSATIDRHCSCMTRAHVITLATNMGIMAAQYGQRSEYHPDTEEIASYLERVEVFIAANGVADEKQAAVFLSVVGARTFALIRELVSPAKPSAKTFQELCYVLRAHFEPKTIVIAEVLLPQLEPRLYENP